MKTMNKGHAGILAMAIFTALVTTYAGSSLNLAIPAIGGEFHASASMLTWIVNTYLLVSVCFSLPFGKIADAISRKAVLIIGCAFYLAFSLLAVFCTSMPLMLAYRVGQALGAGMLFATNIAILVDAFPANQRGWVMGFYTAATYVGISLGPVLGGVLTTAFGWRSVFVSMALICLAALVSSVIFVPGKAKGARSAGMPEGKADWAGMLLFIFALGIFLYGISTIINSWMGLVLSIIGLALCIFLCAFELRRDNPFVDVRMFAQNKNFSFSNLAALFNYAATFAVSYWLSIYLQQVKGMTARAAGLFMISQPILQAIISPISGRMSDKHSPFILASAGMAVCTAALACFVFFHVDTSLAAVMGVLLVIGLGFGLFSSPNQTAIMSSVAANQYSMASSLIATSRSVGEVFCMAIIAFVSQACLGGQTLQQSTKLQIALAFRVSFAIFACICAVGVFISLQRKNKASDIS
jgi:EmrB/QacA subfamily drug resistance transporter